MADVNLHELAEERSLAIHRVIADRLRHDSSLHRAALTRAEGWLADGSVHRRYAEAWRDLLAGPLEPLLTMLTDPGETA